MTDGKICFLTGDISKKQLAELEKICKQCGNKLEKSPNLRVR